MITPWNLVEVKSLIYRSDLHSVIENCDYEDLPHLDEDKLRSDQLNCFWITDYNTLSSKPGAIRRMYVCLDSDTGAIIPQQIEVIEAPLL